MIRAAYLEEYDAIPRQFAAQNGVLFTVCANGVKTGTVQEVYLGEGRLAGAVQPTSCPPRQTGRLLSQ
jgi:hypothetical protein